MRTSTQLMTALHVLLLQGKKSAEDTLQTAKLLMDHGLRELINEPDSLGNTPLHALIVRYALEVIKLYSRRYYFFTEQNSRREGMAIMMTHSPGISGTCFILPGTCYRMAPDPVLTRYSRLTLVLANLEEANFFRPVTAL